MADVLEQGSRRPPPRWAGWAAAVALAAGGIGYVAVRPPGGSPSAGGSAPTTPPSPVSPSSTSSPSGTSRGPTPGAPPWPSRAGACGSDAALPMVSVPRLRERTGMHVLVGGSGLRRVDVDTGRTEPVRGLTPSAGRQVQALVSTAGRDYALAVDCAATSSRVATVFRVDGRSGAAATGRAGSTDALLSGAGGVWRVSYPKAEQDRVALRPVEGGAPLRMPPRFYPLVATADRFLGVMDSVPGGGPGEPPALATVDRALTGAPKAVGTGFLMAASDGVAVSADRLVLPEDPCGPDGTCVLTSRTWQGAAVRRFPLPQGRAPVSFGVLSPDDRLVAFLLGRSQPDPRYASGHPLTPSDPAVLDLATGTLRVLPGVELAPKSSANLEFSRDSRWLAIALDEGNRARLLVWRPGLTRPQESPAALPGPVLYGVPVLAVEG